MATHAHRSLQQQQSACLAILLSVASELMDGVQQSQHNNVAKMLSVLSVLFCFVCRMSCLLARRARGFGEVQRSGDSISILDIFVFDFPASTLALYCMTRDKPYKLPTSSRAYVSSALTMKGEPLISTLVSDVVRVTVPRFPTPVYSSAVCSKLRLHGVLHLMLEAFVVTAVQVWLLGSHHYNSSSSTVFESSDQEELPLQIKPCTAQGETAPAMLRASEAVADVFPRQRYAPL